MKGFLIGGGILLGIVTVAGLITLAKRCSRRKNDRDIGIIMNEKTGEWRWL